MVPIEALKLALLKEEASMKLYKDLAKKHRTIRELLTQLYDQEYRHKKLIEDKIRELTKY
ncbi:MAG: hypothetical protein NG737_07070 [Omnitrophica bacterium]|nr:hypothetical protein [Candidatus Omnitrophota bacterium]